MSRLPWDEQYTANKNNNLKRKCKTQTQPDLTHQLASRLEADCLYSASPYSHTHMDTYLPFTWISHLVSLATHLVAFASDLLRKPPGKEEGVLENQLGCWKYEEALVLHLTSAPKNLGFKCPIQHHPNGISSSFYRLLYLH